MVIDKKLIEEEIQYLMFYFKKLMEPLIGFISPIKVLTNVLFPEPFGPEIRIRSLSFIF